MGKIHARAHPPNCLQQGLKTEKKKIKEEALLEQVQGQSSSE